MVCFVLPRNSRFCFVSLVIKTRGSVYVSGEMYSASWRCWFVLFPRVIVVPVSFISRERHQDLYSHQDGRMVAVH